MFDTRQFSLKETIRNSDFKDGLLITLKKDRNDRSLIKSDFKISFYNIIGEVSS